MSGADNRWLRQFDYGQTGGGWHIKPNNDNHPQAALSY
jgi:hypothetical protein